MVRSRALLIILMLTACTASHDVDRGGFDIPPEVDSGNGEGTGGTSAEMLGSCQEQIDEQQDGMPVELACTGLYSDLKSKKLTKNVELYAPAYKFWSDGAEKFRYISLPKGEQIDSSDPAAWQFPVGTKIWKEFRQNERRAETRLYTKVRSDKWRSTTYVWSKDEKTAEREDNGRMMPLNGYNYEVPNAGTCNDCHDGSSDSILGFEMISLGLPDAEGLTLQRLVDEDLLSDPPAKTSFAIGDDGTGKARDVLGFLHINCGVTCHNDGVNSKAEETDLRMKLNFADLDGSPTNDIEVLKNLIDVEAKTTQWQGQKRIVPGKPDESLLYKLITTRLGIDGNKQMPPLVTRVVDKEHADMIREWILALKPADGATAQQ
jgi:hypothetical protein